MLQFIRFTLVALVAAAVFVPLAHAQQRTRGGVRLGSVTSARLLAIDTVQTELKLSDNQKKKAGEINETLTKARRELFQKVAKESRERAEKVAELDSSADASVKELLSDEQEKRLGELLLQVNGASELLKKDVADALHITEAQNKKLTEANRANAKARKEALENFEGDRQAKTAELKQEEDKKLLAILTDEQKKKFDEMQGKKIEIKVFASQNN
jgi:hypothetical protein